ncbi:MAG: hypothetical protein O3B09_03805, partial [Proteobacteria bacterium]|nr:hypothetical protein [Pseudomonadota bacterium]
MTSSCKCSSVSSGGAVQCIGDSPSSQCQDKYNRIKATVTRLDAKKKIVLGNLTRILNNMLKVFGGGADLNKIQIDVNQGGITNDNHDDVDFDKIYQEMKKSCEEKKRLGKPL